MNADHPRYKAAVVQAAPVYMDLDASVEKAVGLIEEAAEGGARLVAFPETWLPGYPWWLWLGSPAWGMQFVQRYHDNSLVIDSPQTQRLLEAARENAIHVVMGYSERSGGSRYMGQMLVSDRGHLVATRRKLKPTHVERTLFGEGDGGDLAVHEMEGLGRVGALCCWEHLQPLTKYAMYSMGEQVHVASWPSFSLYNGVAYALGPQLNTSASQMYAAEGQCFVLAACATVSEEMVEMVCDTPDKRDLLRAGGGHAMIFGPDGSPLAEPLPEDVEGLLFADIDIGTIAIAKVAADPVGHYSRPDVTRLLLNGSPSPKVQNMDPEMRLVETEVSPADGEEQAERIRDEELRIEG